ncbi:NAD(P)-binding protein [Phanerochaete sordida]|uniref:NAD(P)-binding protein n=1 Tax=Phanerochaete sordida TaxID=48140 RepID=A0A9P3GP37_9APHY|nr:NAD(P)-binding protein [Phanerochaete sordida]
MGGLLSQMRYMSYGLAQTFPPKAQFSTEQMPDLTGKVCLVTGGNTGVGKETVKALLEHNATVYLAARSREKAEQAIADLQAATGRAAVFLELDLASLASVRRAAKEFLSHEKELHVLFNNAGVMWPPLDQLTEDGFDLQWGTNVVGHWLFTELLVPALAAAAKGAPDGHSRVVTTSSSGAYLEGLHYDTFRDSPKRKKLGKQGLYFQSKLGNAMVAREAAKRYAEKGILSFTCNPGNLNTELQRYATPFQQAFISRITYHASFGALTQLWAGTMPEAAKYNGEFLIPWARVGKCRDEFYDDKEIEKLWKWLEENTKEAAAA